MLPTKGYFQDIECPYYDSSCGRPYCHFRHRKKASEILEDIATEAVKEEVEAIPTYKPTPKSELANIHNSKSHIPISYVPDLAFRPDRKYRPPPKFDKPTYKPTPLSILSSANQGYSISEANGEHTEAIKEIKQNIANVEYNPAISLQPTTDIDFEDLSTEFDLIDEIINSNDGTSKMIIDHVNKEDELLENENLSSECIQEIDDVKLEPDINEKKSKLDDIKPEPKQEKNVEHDKVSENIDIKSEKHCDKKEKRAVNLKNLDKVEKEKKDHDKEKKEHNKKYEKNDKSKQDKHKTSEKSEDEKSKGIKDKQRLEKHNSSEKNRSEKEKPSTSKEKTKENKKGVHDKSHKSSSRDKHRKEQKKDRKEDRHSSHKSKDKRTDRSRSEDRKKGKDCEKEKEKNKKHCDNDKKHRSKSKDKDSHKPHHKHSKSDKKRIKNKTEESEKITFEESSNDSHDNVPLLSDNIENTFSDLDLDDDDETMLECYKIFNEYKPPEKPTIERDTRKRLVEEDASVNPGDDLTVGKKRIAHSNIEKTVTYSQLHPPNKQKTLNTPGQVLTNRYKIAKLAQASKEQEFIMNEITQPIIPSKRPAPTLLEAAREQKLRKEHSQAKLAGKGFLVDDIIKGTTKPYPSQPKIVVRKIAPAQNVGLIEKAKERISKIKQSTQIKTVAQTQKSGRVAHVPEMSLSDIPDVLQADKSKLPVNVRTRFLTMIADECLKLYISKEEAFTRALNEEFACYEKCKVLATYRNSAMLAVNRLRREIQERDKLGLGLIGLGEDSGKSSSSDFAGRNFYNNVKKWILTSEELDIHGYPRESEEHHGRAVIKNKKNTVLTNLDSNQRTCCRCHKIYQVDDDGWPLFEEECLYHPLKKRTIRGEQTYLCCRSNDSTGCATSDTHVSESSSEAELEGYQITMDPEYEDDSRSYAVYALDCEMCYTTKGLELTRVTIVDSECKTVYESLVKPLNPIIDYNTRFSGITKEQMDKTSTSILQIQANILHLCNSKTILVGHSLESDMKALKIVHETIIDTSILFPHKMGLPHKRALKALASEHLRKIIQNDVSGHDSAEDAITCMELIKWKLKDELKLRGSKLS